MQSTELVRSLRADSGRPAKLEVEDLIGRTLMLVWFLSAAGRQALQLLGTLSQQHAGPGWLLDFTHGLLVVIFSAVAVCLTVLRKPAKAVAQGIEPRITAILGSFLILTLPFLPEASGGVDLRIISIPITMVGLGLSIYCMLWLGQSFSVMAAARVLVTLGPYSVVRHPLYASEMIAIVGIVLGAFSLPAVLLLMAIVALQLRRTVNEEGVLRAAFPEYEEYARRIPRVIPRFQKKAAVGRSEVRAEKVAGRATSR